MALANFQLGMQYPVILIDPPWYFKNYSKAGEKKQPPYPTMTLEELQALDVASHGAHDCAFFMWTTGPFNKISTDLMEHWGFTYKTMLTWVKMNKDFARPSFGTGYVFRGASEYLLYGSKGKPRLRQTTKAKSVRSALITHESEIETYIDSPEPDDFTIFGVRDRHSRKPVEAHQIIETLFDGPYLELFARPPVRSGWDAMGNEI
jgi:N6-adenosine-specific RNA methylase IME4